MPRNGSGTYTLPEPSFVPGTVISSTAMNSNLSDIALALTGSMATDGQSAFTGNFQISDGSALTPSYSFVSDSSDGMYHPSSGIVGLAIGGIAGFTFGAASPSRGAGILGQNGAILIPVGIILDFAGPTAPFGWFFCYGQAIPRAQYPHLFNVIGTTYGAGDGSSTFNLPDLRGRVAAGNDNMGGATAGRLSAVLASTTNGAAGGDQLAQQHNHANNASTSLTDHTHDFDLVSIRSFGTVVTTTGKGTLVTPLSGGTQDTTTYTTFNNTPISASTSVAITDNLGGHSQNVQPTMIVNKIIFPGAA